MVLLGNLKIRTVTLVTTLLIGVLALVSGAMALRFIDGLGDSLSYSSDNTVPSLSVLGEVAQHQAQARILISQHILADTRSETRRIDEELATTLKETDARISSYKNLVSDAEEEKLFNQFTTTWSEWKNEVQAVRSASMACAPKRRPGSTTGT